MDTTSFVKPVFLHAAGSPIRELKKYSDLPGMVSLAGGYPSNELMDAQGLQEVLQGLSRSEFSAALQYGGTEGTPALRCELATLSNQRGLQVDASELMVLSGSQQGIDLIARTLISPGDTVLVEAPTYPAALSAFRLAGAVIHQLENDANGICFDRLEATLIKLKPKLIYIVTTFANPSAKTMPPAHRHALLELAVKHQCLILEDDPYSELWFDTPPPAAIFAMRHQIDGGEKVCVYLSSLSKTLAPALRLGWILGPADIRRACVLAKQSDDMQASTLTQTAAAAYLASGQFHKNLPKLRDFYALRAHTLASEINITMQGKITLTAPQGGMFIWCKAPRIDTSMWLQVAIKHNVMFVPGAAFFAHDPDTSAFRLSFASQNLAGLHTGVQRLSQSLDEFSA
jgi:2-aminoadipate transaminase